MLNTAEAARRRELHQRVYAPGGSLTDAEIAELHDLDNRHLRPPETEPEPVVPPEPEDPAAVRGSQHAVSGPEDAASRDLRTEGADESDAAPAGAAPADGAPADAAPADAAPAGAARADRASRAPRRRWLQPLVVAVAVLVGLGAGWLLFAPDAHRTMMTTAQQDVWSDLEASGDYDAGSIQLVGEKYGATAWAATQDNAKRTCIVLTKKELDPATGCRSSTGDYEGFDLQVNLDYTEGDDHYVLFAMLIEDVSGNPVTVIQQQNMTDSGWDWRSQYTREELAQVAVLESAGIQGESLSLLGYDGSTPVWMYQQDETCLAVVINATDVAQQCGTLTTDLAAPLQLTVGDVVYSVSDSPNRGASLTVLRPAAANQITCDAETGRCTWVDDTPVEAG